MKNFSSVVLGGLLFFFMIGPLATANDPEESKGDDTTAKIDILLRSKKSKTITVSLEQTAMDVYNLCKSAAVYADDDPWLGYAAAGGGHYVLMFYAEGTMKEMRGRPDANRDKLYPVVHYPSMSLENGRFILPKAWRDRTCGDHVTLKVPVGPDKAKIATVVLGMSPQDVMSLFQPAPDQWDDDHGIIFDSIDDDGKILLTFSAEDDNSASDRKSEKLSEVMYRPGGQTEMHFLLPREKRGTPILDKYRTLLQKGKREQSEIERQPVSNRKLHQPKSTPSSDTPSDSSDRDDLLGWQYLMTMHYCVKEPGK
ncbi:MAG: hypothetical protein JW829_19275 [Pirellulales bacterium]|nr:hypothetical protein [Pirellulales bacterium]